MAEKPIKTLWVASCVHIGAFDQAEDDFAIYLALAKKNNWDIAFIGDMLDFGVACGTKHIGSVFQNAFGPQAQLDKFVELVKPLRKQIIGIFKGNHERRAFNAVGLEVAKIISNELDVPYYGASGVIPWRGLNVFLSHGASNGRFTDFEKIVKMRDDLDVIVLGHTHELNHFQLRKFDSNGESRLIECARAGSFLDNSEYAKEALYPPTPIGSILLEKYSNGVNVRVGIIGV